MSRGYARSRAKNEAVRQELRPLEPGERPTAVTVAAVVAALLGIANVVLLITGGNLDDRTRRNGAIAFAVVMLVAAVFMWRGKYWAVLGFQALLAISIVIAALALLFASNVEAVIRSVLIIVPAAVLFWYLIRAMARLQMPTRTR
jgi:hypothetical protein